MFLMLIRSLFIPQTKDFTEEDFAVVIQSMGYTKNDYSGYTKEYFDGKKFNQTRIEIKGNGVEIKTYKNGMVDSDVLNFPIPSKKELKRFIKYNEV